MASFKLESLGPRGTTSRSVNDPVSTLREKWYVKYSWLAPEKRTTTIPRRYRKMGSRLTVGHSLDSRTDIFNESGFSGSQNADLTHLALYAGGIVGSSLQSAASGFPTGSAGFVSNSMKALSRSQENSSSASESFSSTFTSSSRGVVLTLSSRFSPSSLGVRWRELDEERVPGP